MRRFYKLSEFKKYHEKKNRSPITSAYAPSLGDVVSIWDVEVARNVEFEVVGREPYENVILGKPLERGQNEVMKINIEKHMCYILHSSEVNNLRDCECGARHTSNPNIHLFYCKLWTPR